jgi:hypothetical protein
MQIGLLFSVIVPIIPAFCVVFFLFKYYVDKYNLSFVYDSEFLGLGKVQRRIIPLCYFNIVMYQLLTIGYFQSNTMLKKEPIYFKIGAGFIAGELLIVAIFVYSRYRGTK